MPVPGNRRITKWRHSVLIASTIAAVAIGAGGAVVGTNWPSVDPTPTPPITLPDTHLCDAPVGKNSWYVKNGGSGTNNGTSWNNAWTSFASVNWASILPGDKLFINGGPLYASVYTEKFKVGASGTAGNPITICPGQDAGHSGIVKFDYESVSPAGGNFGAIDIRGRSWVTISGNYGGARHLEINNLFNSVEQTFGVGIADTAGGAGNVTIDHVRFVNDNNGIRAAGPVGTGWVIQHNSFEGIRGDAAVSLSDNGGPELALDAELVYNNYIETLYSTTTSPVGGGPDGIQTSSGMTIKGNTFVVKTTAQYTSGQHPDSIQSPTNNVKVVGNTFTNVGDSNFDFDLYRTTTPHDIYVENNIFQVVTAIDPYPDFIRVYMNSSLGTAPTSFTNVVIANNLFADADSGTNIPPINVCFYNRSCANPTVTGSRITNNIFVNNGDSNAAGGKMLFLSNNAGAGWTADHNVYYRATDGSINWKGTSYTPSSFVATVDTFGSVALPLFVGYTPHGPSNDFHLQAGDTVARDKGVSLSSLFTTDFAGISRPVGAAWDIGPYER